MSVEDFVTLPNEDRVHEDTMPEVPAADPLALEGEAGEGTSTENAAV